MTNRLPGRPPREHEETQKALISFPLGMHQQIRALASLYNIPMSQLIRQATSEKILALLSQTPTKMF